MLSLAVDVGGTFTDLVLVDSESGTVSIGKTATTTANPSIGVVDGSREVLGRLGVPIASLGQVSHCTTLVDNLIVERKGAKVASLIVTSNKPFSVWGEVFGDDDIATAMIDRLVHHAEILSLKGDSYRFRGKDLAPGRRATIQD